jgi:hypothetical protein
MTVHREAGRLANAILDQRGRSHCYGRFLLHIIDAPAIPKRGSSEWRQILEQGAAYVGVTGNSESRMPERLFADDGGFILIEKVARRCGSEIIVRFSSKQPDE